MKIKFLSFCLSLLFAAICIQQASATHNRAGEITYVQTGDLTIIATITTYTKASSDQADRDSLTIDWGDGTISQLPRTNGLGNGEIRPGDIKYNTYVGEHTYPGRSTYTMSMQDPNRIGNILNINNSNSLSVRFYLETTVTFLNPQFQGYNTSAVLLAEPIDEACIDQRFVHLPNAYDAEGDSLAFELITPLQGMEEEVDDYVLPSSVSPGPGNQVFFNPMNGEFIWDSPQRAGEYNIAIRINEYRNGVLLNSIIRDMQITVRMCDNRPPVVTTDEKVCVVAGEHLVLDITVDDPDNDQKVNLEASGGPFIISPDSAVLIVDEGYQPKPLVGQFSWATTCNHISRSDYSVVFKGEDDFFKSELDTTGLVDLHELSIHVSGPPPENLDALSAGNAIQLEWDAPYSCEVTLNEFFRGFTIWRKLVPTEVILDTCGTDLEQYNYTPIQFQVKTQNGNKYFYQDLNVEKGITYCYRVTAEFALISPGGNPYNQVQSLPSDEICLQVERDLPLITHVTVDETSDITGQITVRWVGPIAADLDTLENTGPYRYTLLRSPGIGTVNFSPVAGATFNAATFSDLLNFTEFIDQNINTEIDGYTYALDFYSADLNDAYGQSQPASSVFLTIVGTDRRNQLAWDYEVPWFIRDHVIYRENTLTGTFDSLAMTEDLSFEDFPVVNDTQYCYYVKTVGSYGLRDIPDPLENLSQIVCAVPTDSIPPCAPVVSVINSCNDSLTNPIDDLVNLLLWNYDTGICFDSLDIALTEIYYISNITLDTVLIAELEGLDIRTYEHNLESEESGCYIIRAIDINDNYGEFSNIACGQTCPEYELPNVFTPNNDGANDVFIPFPYQFVTRVDMQIFTRWGTKVFETEDPDINWDGTDLNGNDVSEDVYFYTCRVFSGGELTGFLQEDLLKGNITLIRD